LRDIEVKIKSNQVGEFEVQGRIIYYFDEDRANAEDQTLRLPIRVRDVQQTTTMPTKENRNWLPGFGALIALIGILALYIIKKNRTK